MTCHAGDTSQNLLWRLKNGEAPEGLSPDAVVILVGTNDLSKSFITKVRALTVFPSAACTVDCSRLLFCTSRLLAKTCAERGSQGSRISKSPQIKQKTQLWGQRFQLASWITLFDACWASVLIDEQDPCPSGGHHNHVAGPHNLLGSCFAGHCLYLVPLNLSPWGFIKCKPCIASCWSVTYQQHRWRHWGLVGLIAAAEYHLNVGQAGGRQHIC